ncbi:MAG: hypothetical protein ABJ242_11350 [Marinomonas sp.]
MIAILLTVLFVAVAVIALGSLADSAVRGRNAWRSIQREMALEMQAECSSGVTADVVAFRDIRPLRQGRYVQAELSVTRQLAAAA